LDTTAISPHTLAGPVAIALRFLPCAHLIPADTGPLSDWRQPAAVHRPGPLPIQDRTVVPASRRPPPSSIPAVPWPAGSRSLLHGTSPSVAACHSPRGPFRRSLHPVSAVTSWPLPAKRTAYRLATLRSPPAAALIRVGVEAARPLVAPVEAGVWLSTARREAGSVTAARTPPSVRAATAGPTAMQSRVSAGRVASFPQAWHREGSIWEWVYPGLSQAGGYSGRSGRRVSVR